MFIRFLKNTEKIYWTEHAKFKMQFYGLSPQRVLGIISKPARKEEGIVKNTIAVMKPVSPKIMNNKAVWKQEVWAMYQKLETRNSKLVINESRFKLRAARYKIISAWRYPGISPRKNPIPESIIEEISSIV